MVEPVQRVAVAIDRFRAGEVDAFDIDQVILQYSWAAKELWKFCSLSDVEFTAQLINDQAPTDWWARVSRGDDELGIGLADSTSPTP